MTYEIDMGALKRSFLSLQQALHPDRFTLHDDVRTHAVRTDGT